MKKIGMICVALLLAGCSSSTYISNVNPNAQEQEKTLIEQIVKNVTTAEQVLEMFGEPVLKEEMNEFDVQWTYQRGEEPQDIFMIDESSKMMATTIKLIISDNIVKDIDVSIIAPLGDLSS